MFCDSDLNDLSREELYSVINHLRSDIKYLKIDLIKLKLLSDCYLKYFGFFYEITETFDSNKEVLDLLAKIKSLNNENQCYVSLKRLESHKSINQILSNEPKISDLRSDAINPSKSDTENNSKQTDNCDDTNSSRNVEVSDYQSTNQPKGEQSIVETSEETNNHTSNTIIGPKKSRGRPKKQRPECLGSDGQKWTEETNNHEPKTIIGPKKSRGRPRKQRSECLGSDCQKWTEETNNQEPKTIISPKKSRGRPKKQELIGLRADTIEETKNSENINTEENNNYKSNQILIDEQINRIKNIIPINGSNLSKIENQSTNLNEDKNYINSKVSDTEVSNYSDNYTAEEANNSKDQNTGGPYVCHQINCGTIGCAFCGKQSKDIYSAKYHLLGVHPEECPEVPFMVCQQNRCHYRTKLIDNWKRHKKAHTLPFTCDQKMRTEQTVMSKNIVCHNINTKVFGNSQKTKTVNTDMSAGKASDEESTNQTIEEQSFVETSKETNDYKSKQSLIEEQNSDKSKDVPNDCNNQQINEPKSVSNTKGRDEIFMDTELNEIKDSEDDKHSTKTPKSKSFFEYELKNQSIKDQSVVETSDETNNFQSVNEIVSNGPKPSDPRNDDNSYRTESFKDQDFLSAKEVSNYESIITNIDPINKTKASETENLRINLSTTSKRKLSDLRIDHNSNQTENCNESDLSNKKVATKPEESKHCDFEGCVYIASAIYNLKIHKLNHSNKRYSGCQYCGKLSKGVRASEYHLLTVHPEKCLEFSYIECLQKGCGYKTKHSAKMFAHKRSHNRFVSI